jgi:glycosyltransferase involved in cell wall biosynthesis
VSFIVQWNEPIRTEDGTLYAPDPEFSANPRVRLITAPLNSAAYDAALLATDCMVLPYRNASYYARISGVAIEAATAGIPMIYTANSWIADLAEKMGSGISVRDGDVDGLVAALEQLYDEQTAFRTRARQTAAAARAAHSDDSFLAALWTAKSALSHESG